MYKKLAKKSSGGGGDAAAQAAAKKEEKKKDPQEESDDEMGYKHIKLMSFYFPLVLKQTFLQTHDSKNLICSNKNNSLTTNTILRYFLL
jgi:hypothetical protein